MKPLGALCCPLHPVVYHMPLGISLVKKQVQVSTTKICDFKVYVCVNTNLQTTFPILLLEVSLIENVF